MAASPPPVAKQRQRSRAPRRLAGLWQRPLPLQVRTSPFVHGIGRQPPRAQLKLEWALALFGKGLGDRGLAIQ